MRPTLGLSSAMDRGSVSANCSRGWRHSTTKIRIVVCPACTCGVGTISRKLSTGPSRRLGSSSTASASVSNPLTLIFDFTTNDMSDCRNGTSKTDEDKEYRNVRDEYLDWSEGCRVHHVAPTHYYFTMLRKEKRVIFALEPQQ